MAMAVPVIGIDFGTSKSSMAWVNTRTGEAELLRNEEGRDETPSVVYFGEHQTLVGEPAEHMIEVGEERDRIVVSVKRDLANTSTLSLPGKRVKRVDVAAEVLRKLKRDAENLHFLTEVTRAVITVPAAFDTIQKQKIEQAGKLAGFAEIALVEEPVAAALAYSRAGLQVGDSILVYDLGAGTFDLALLARDNGGFRLAFEPRGLASCGGDDFDRALYALCDDVALRQLGRSISANGHVDLHFLRLCRQRKENLSNNHQSVFSDYLTGDGTPVQFRHTVDRASFEESIAPLVAQTVQQTKRLVSDAGDTGQAIDTAVLIGGSTRVPLVKEQLKGSLPLEPLDWQHRDTAVALGAAYYGATIWADTGPSTSPTKRPRSESPRGKDVEIGIELSEDEAARGGKKTVTAEVLQSCPKCDGTGWLQGGEACWRCEGEGTSRQSRSLEVTIKPGIKAGKKIRLKGHGDVGNGGAVPGDLVVRIDAIHPSSGSTAGRSHDTSTTGASASPLPNGARADETGVGSHSPDGNGGFFGGATVDGSGAALATPATGRSSWGHVIVAGAVAMASYMFYETYDWTPAITLGILCYALLWGLAHFNEKALGTADDKTNRNNIIVATVVGVVQYGLYESLSPVPAILVAVGCYGLLVLLTRWGR